MNEQYTTVDKSKWDRGPWDTEPDKVVWVDEATDLDCMAHRGPAGHWCGYVGVPEGHWAHGANYDDVDALNPNQDVWVAAHGGLTFASACQPHPDGPQFGVCHIAQPGRPDNVWWLGFDCAHAGDLSPGRVADLREHGLAHLVTCWPLDSYDTYRDLDYVVAEVTSLATQLAEVGTG
jgi:hypothetical protein